MLGGNPWKISAFRGKSDTPQPPQTGVYLHGFATASRSNTLTLPSGCQAGDILVLWASGLISSFGSMFGWNNLLSRGYGGTTPGCNFMWRRLPAGFSNTVTLNDGRFSSIIGVFRNVRSASSPIDGPNHVFSGGFGDQPDPPAYTTTIGIGTALIACACKGSEQTKTSVVAPSGYTLVAAEDGAGDGRSETVAMAYKILSASGSENPPPYSGFSSTFAHWLGESTSLAKL